MGQDKHQPKDNKKKFTFSNDAEKTLIGIMIFLISIFSNIKTPKKNKWHKPLKFNFYLQPHVLFD